MKIIEKGDCIKVGRREVDKQAHFSMIIDADESRVDNFMKVVDDFCRQYNLSTCDCVFEMDDPDGYPEFRIRGQRPKTKQELQVDIDLAKALEQHHEQELKDRRKTRENLEKQEYERLKRKFEK